MKAPRFSVLNQLWMTEFVCTKKREKLQSKANQEAEKKHGEQTKQSKAKKISLSPRRLTPYFFPWFLPSLSPFTWNKLKQANPNESAMNEWMMCDSQIPTWHFSRKYTSNGTKKLKEAIFPDINRGPLCGGCPFFLASFFCSFHKVDWWKNEPKKQREREKKFCRSLSGRLQRHVVLPRYVLH